MRPSAALTEHRRAIRDYALSHNIRNVWVFGSVARGDDSESSDVDLLVDAMPNATLFDLGSVQQFASQILRFEVDLVELAAIPHTQRSLVLKSAIAL